MGCDFGAPTVGSDEVLAIRKCLIHFFQRANVVVARVIYEKTLVVSLRTYSARHLTFVVD